MASGSSRPQQVLRHTPESLYVTLGSSVAESLRATSNNMLVNLITVNQMDPYDSDSSDGGSEFPSVYNPGTPLSTNLNYETYSTNTASSS
jgi:hypothetical protein